MKYQGLILLFAVVTLAAFSTCKRSAPASLNLDFELIDVKTKFPLHWTVANLSSGILRLDSTTVHNGKYSCLIQTGEQLNLQSGSIQAYRIIENIHPEKSIRLSGFIKTENVSCDSTGLAFGYASFIKDTVVTLKDKRLLGTSDWQEFSFELPVTDDPDYSYIGISLKGKGKIWVDDLKLFVDGRELLTMPPKPKFKATRKELAWLKKNYTPLKTVKAGSGFEDLQPLKSMIGNARIVGLGENTHGTSEVFMMKHRLIEFLATEMGFNIFSIEANMPEAYCLNNYVLKNEGDPKELLKGMYFWTWNTKEVLDMIYWMKRFNTDRAGKIQFTGFDMQYYMGSLQNLSEYSNKSDKVLKFKTDSIAFLFENLKQKGSKALESKDEIGIIKTKCNSLHSYLIRNRQAIIQNSDTVNYNWLVQNSTVLLQCIELAEMANSGFIYRDKSMAANIKWILDNNPGSKIVLWAHNGHVTKHIGHMGYYLNREFGNQYYNIGFLSNSGTYTAVNSGMLNSNNVLETGIPGSFEYTFHRTGTPVFYFDFSRVKDTEPDGQWLRSKLDYRSIGALALPKQFNPTMLSKHFNAIIYIDSTSATRCFDIK